MLFPDAAAFVRKRRHVGLFNGEEGYAKARRCACVGGGRVVARQDTLSVHRVVSGPEMGKQKWVG